jgi:microcystin-dependent protein
VLRAKAGSKIRYPDGKNEDGSLRFGEIVLESDIVVITATSTGTFMIMMDKSLFFRNQNVATCYSGSTTPTVSNQYNAWYDTANNIVKLTNDTGATWTGQWSLPLCVTRVENGVLKTVDQVFNGAGKIGSMCWINKNVTALSGQGRNADGSIKNAVKTTNDIKLIDNSGWDALTTTYSGYLIYLKSVNRDAFMFQPYYRFVSSREQASATNTLYYYFDENEAQWYMRDNKDTLAPFEKAEVYIYADMTTKGGDFEPRGVFRAADYNELKGELELNMPVGTILPYGGSSAPSGYLLCNGATISRTTYVNLFKVIGTTYGAGDGSTTFALPNYSSARMVTSATVGVKGDGKGLGITGGGKSGGWRSGASNGQISFMATAYGKTSDKAVSSQNPGEYYIGVVTNTTNSGLTGTASLASTCKFIIKY